MDISQTIFGNSRDSHFQERSQWKSLKIIYFFGCRGQCYDIFFNRGFCCLVCFLRKLWVWEKIPLKLVNREKWRTYCETVRKAVKLCDTRWKRESWEVWSLYSDGSFAQIAGALYITVSGSYLINSNHIGNSL